MPAVEKLFERSVSMTCLSLADLYGSKICAALDRQHPRDWFDVKWLLDAEGLTDQVRQAFIVYLISHNRPMCDLLDPNWQDLESAFFSQFQGMTRLSVSCEDLLDTRDRLLTILHENLTETERRFILSVKKKNPDWELFPIQGIKNLPAVQWKLQSLADME